MLILVPFGGKEIVSPLRIVKALTKQLEDFYFILLVSCSNF